METILYITPHLSTGGLPQFLTKQVELLKDAYNVYVVEYNDVTGGAFVVQKNKIIKLIGDRLITLPEDHNELHQVIERAQPDIIHIVEFSESFIEEEIAKMIYSSDRKYKIFETSHGSHLQLKRFLPDAFIFVSPSQLEQYKDLGVPMHIVEYPIEDYVRPSRTEGLVALGLDPFKKHVLNVGLFTPGKNQGEIFEYAKALPSIQFHFVGNQASNFADYWQPLMVNKPDNCIIWGERNDTEAFYSCMDMLLFTSKLELNPLVIREAISWKVPILMYNLPVYQNSYDQYKNIQFLTPNKEVNLKMIKGEKPDIFNEIVIITAYPDTDEKMGYLNELIDNISSFGYDIMLSSHFDIPKWVRNKVTYSVIDLTDNLLYKEEYAEHGVTNTVYNRTDKRLLQKSTEYTHGYAVWTLWENAMLELRGMEADDVNSYDKVHIIDYDCIITDKRYIEHHSALLQDKDFVFYNSTDYFNTDKRVTTNLFSAKMTAAYELFSTINTKKEFFVNEWGTSVIEDILHHLVNKYNYKYSLLSAKDLYRFGTKYNMVNITDLEIPTFRSGIFRLDIFRYSDDKDILYLLNLGTNAVTVNSNMYTNVIGEHLYLIDRLPVHKVSYEEKDIDFIMDEHSKYHSIEVYDKTILQ